MTLLPALGLLGGACFAFAAVPTAVTAIRTGRNPGVPINLAWCVFSGTVLVYSYLVFKFFVVSGIDWVLSANYYVEAASWSVILYYHYIPRQA